MVRPVLENSIIFFKIKGFAQLLLFSSFHRFLICIVACVFSFSGVCFMEVNVYFYILFGSLNKSQSSQVCEPHPHRIYTRMTRSQPSLRLKQISRIISRQRDDDTVITSTFLSITLILLIIFLTGVSMLTAGLVIFDSCHQSWLPTWLLVGIMINKR